MVVVVRGIVVFTGVVVAIVIVAVVVAVVAVVIVVGRGCPLTIFSPCGFEHHCMRYIILEGINSHKYSNTNITLHGRKHARPGTIHTPSLNALTGGGFNPGQ